MNQPRFRFLFRLMPFIFLLAFAASGQETQRQYLSGHGKDDAVPWKFLCTTGAQSGFWTNLPVPSNWELHGFGTLNYKKDSTNAWDERGLYAHDFAVPASWSSQRVFLVFEGVMTDTSAKFNGESVGPLHQGGFYRFKYEVTKLIKCGATNKLEVTVAKHSANESVNKAERLADYWVFGGIFRPVYLEAVPPEFIERVAIDARADGTFTLDVFLNDVTNSVLVEAQIMSLAGQPVGEEFSVPVLAGFGRPAVHRAKLQTSVSSPLQWTAETPNLYRLEVRLKRGDQILHRYSQRFGFRTMEVRDGDGLYVNGRKIILKGVNRHSFWPDSGRCLSEAVHRLDIETIKDMNGNAVRMSHYPPDTEFLDLCDELGLYVLDELAGWHNHYDNEVGARLVEKMVTRDVNHPSILFWNNGNEGGFNTNLDKLFGEFDPQKRRVLHPWATFSGINTSHYLAYDKAQIASRGVKTYYADGQEHVVTNDPTKYIYLPTEFMHGLYDGGAGAGLEDYWSMMMKSPLCAGGFIWAFTDDGVKRPDTGQIDTAGNQAPDGIVGPYREREGSFYAIREIWSPTTMVRETNIAMTIKVPALQMLLGKTISVREAPENIEATGGDLTVSINRKTGMLSRVKRGRQEYSFTNGPSMTSEGTKLVGLKVDATTENTATIIRATFEGDLKEVSWRIRNDGWLQCDYKYTATGTQDFFGVVFDYPENLVMKKRWLGDGPFRVWKNRLRGVSLGVWGNDYNNTITGYRDWQYPEFKGCFANVRWLQLETTEGLITVVPENIPFMQVLTPEQPPDNLVAKTKVNLPRCGLGFLHAIPPIGTKFKSADQGGPQGQPNVGQGEYSGLVSFYFGKLP